MQILFMVRIFLIIGLAVITACNNKKNTQNFTKSKEIDNTENHKRISSETVDTNIIAVKLMMVIKKANTDEMMALQLTNNSDIDFAAMMKVHNMGTIKMAQLEINKGTDRELKSIAQKINDDQKRQLGELNKIISKHSLGTGDESFYDELMNQMNNMEKDHSGSLDKFYAETMITHLRRAVDMARAYIKFGTQEEQLKKLAKRIITDRQRQIHDLQTWLN